MTRSFSYFLGKYPPSSPFTDEIANAAESLYKKLQRFDLSSVNISEYNQRYFGSHIDTHDARKLNLTKYAFVLSWALAGSKKPLDELVFLDYGGGHGMLSLLAKEAGIATVIHNDIYPVSCEDARTIGQQLAIEADHYIPGDIDDVIKYLQQHSLNCDVLANYDVIEHIYDINDFLLKIPALSEGHLSVFLASAANETNPRIRRVLRQQHLHFEFQDRAYRQGRKPTDTTRALVDVRKEIISEHAPGLGAAEVENLAHLTRGKIKSEIIDDVNAYCDSGVLPDAPDHPTNTCDPLTGNWFEHLMDPHSLVRLLAQNSFEVSVECGYYDSPGSIVKRLVKHSLNAGIRVLGSKGLYLAPFYALRAVR